MHSVYTVYTLTCRPSHSERDNRSLRGMKANKKWRLGKNPKQTTIWDKNCKTTLGLSPVLVFLFLSVLPSLSDPCLYLLICFLFLLIFSFQMENRKGKWEEYLKKIIIRFQNGLQEVQHSNAVMIIVQSQSCSVHLQGHRKGHVKIHKTHRQTRFKAEAVQYCTSISITYTHIHTHIQ